ncbi:GDSL lipase/acylhydrolase family protein [Aspergillus heteromorphus CBS 117.55]|uniref:GDSL lipase/acylhydrolase family protein n=1 Tax=Aspergillus heteromorphus CBS 117.55 TaxID=1448321 RepID=A0A317VMB9_9EURO|nr:GDSL lipase/acylhydrolase family protein [Aspergillus heteromorphus CBS 117.55]PWY75035.1 GDSL lipase/acylhydrolase family protein [Aspergillus heteromorphus CBS 117.55]
MRHVHPLLLALALQVARAEQRWGPSRFSNLVTFGDSYTDDTRFEYFYTHDGSAPPVGWVEPVANVSSSGGYVWGEYVSQYANLSHRYNYAVSGAACSNKITPRLATLGSSSAFYPSVLEYQVPAFTADNNYHLPSGQKFLDIPADETIFALWIGTNDLGVNSFLTDSQVTNTTIPDYIDCVYSSLDGVYNTGAAKYFVLMNLAPLQLAPLYATSDHHGVGPNDYWPDKPSNITEISYRMWEQVATANDVYDYRTPYELLVGNRYPGAKFAVMDTFALISEIYNNPSEYLAAPANVTGYDYVCNINATVCEHLPNLESYLWFDQLHPSVRTHQIIAKEFVNVVRGESRFATYWS